MGYLYANFGLPRPRCSRLKPDERDRRQTSDRQTDVRQKHRLMPPPIRGGGIIIIIMTEYSQLSNTHVFVPVAIETGGYLAPSGGGTSTEDWKMDGQNYSRCQGVHLPIPAAVRRTAAGECGLISNHAHSQLKKPMPCSCNL